MDLDGFRPGLPIVFCVSQLRMNVRVTHTHTRTHTYTYAYTYACTYTSRRVGNCASGCERVEKNCYGAVALFAFL